MMKNNFYSEIKKANEEHAGIQQLQELLGKGRAKKGMFEGDINEGELEIGQVSALLTDIKPAEKIIKDTWLEFNEALKRPLK
jgi:enoyl-[acyl-carrier protein] reductase II